MKMRLWIFAAVLFLLCTSAFKARGESFHATQAGNWHAPSTWRKKEIPPGDSDSNTIYVEAPLALSKGSVSASSFYLYARKEPVHVSLGPLAHLNVLNYFSLRRRSPGVPATVSLQGSMALQGGCFLEGDASFTVDGGYLYGIGRAWVFRSSEEKGARFSIRNGGVVSVRQLFISQHCVIDIDKGEARFDGLGFSDGGVIHIRDGILAASLLEGVEKAKIILGDNGRLLLKGKVNAENVRDAYPGLTLSDEQGPRPVGSLEFAAGSGSFSDYTCVRLPEKQ